MASYTKITIFSKNKPIYNHCNKVYNYFYFNNIFLQLTTDKVDRVLFKQI